MEIQEVRYQEVMSHHSQDISNNNLIINYNQDGANVQVPPTRMQRRMSKINMKDTSDRNFQGTLTTGRTQEEDEPEFFSRKEINAPKQHRSLVAEKARRKGEDTIRVYFFQSDRFRDYDKVEVEITMRVSEFISYAVEDYCTFFLQFTPENINNKTFELKLADFANKNDPNILEINPTDQVEPYFGQTLCLTRKVNRESNLRIIQQKLADSEVFQVSIPFQNGNRMFELPKDKNFGFLIEKVFKACDIVESPNDFILAEYRKFLIYDKNSPITEVVERDFQLMKRKQKQFYDQPEELWQPIELEDIKPNKVGAGLVSHLQPSQPFRQELTTDVQTCFLQGALNLSLENCVFIERYSSTPLSRLLDLVCDSEYEKRYPLTTLVSAYAEDEYLILVFFSRNKRIVRRYKIPEQKRIIFLSEILRLCRIYKKSLTNPK